MNTPRISIVIPVYNGEKYLPWALRSVLAQTFRSWELIVVNDGSTDNTSSIARQFSKEDPRVRYTEQSNQGQASARNNGFLKTNRLSEHVVFLDADDVWKPHALEDLERTMSANPDAVAAHGLAEYIDENGIQNNMGLEPACVLRKRRTMTMGGIVSLNPEHPTTFGSLIVNCWIITPGLCLLRRAPLSRVGVFDKALSPCEDWDYWVRLSRLGNFAFVDQILLQYRRHSANLSADSRVMSIAGQKLRRHFRESRDNTPEQQKLVNKVFYADQMHRASISWQSSLTHLTQNEYRLSLKSGGRALNHLFRAYRGPREQGLRRPALVDP